MTAFRALKAAEAAGIRIELDGEALTLEAAARPPRATLDLLSKHKAEITALLRPAGDGWSPLDWRMFFDQKAQVAAEQGMICSHARARAFSCCIAEWLIRNPARASSRVCLGCGRDGPATEPLLPFGTESSGHAWLHSRCWAAWYGLRRAEASIALAAMEIKEPGTGR